MKTLKFSLFIFLSGMIIASCTKTGSTGPQGPAGANGTANISTTTFTVIPGQWETIIPGVRYEVYLSVPAITDSNADAVEISGNAVGLGTKWIILPVNGFLYTGDEVIVKYGNQQINIHYLYTSAPTIDTYFKVTVIPPAIIKQHPGLSNQQIIQWYGQPLANDE